MNNKRVNKIPIYITQPFTQIIIYLLLYGFSLKGLKEWNLFKSELSIGMALIWLSYVFFF